MLDLLLHGMTTYGPLVLGLAMLPAAVGVPVPGGALLIAAGALVRQDIMDWQAALFFAWLGATLSDALSYALGRWTGQWARGRLNGRYAAVWHHAEERFGDHGGWAVFATSWLIRGLAFPTNLIAGSSRYSFRRFVAWDAAGKLFWILLHAWLGYAFGGQWQIASETVRSHGGWLALCAIAGIGISLLLRRLRVNQGHAVREAPTESG